MAGNGRDSRGRFLKGEWRGGLGAPAHKRRKRVQEWRKAIDSAVSPDDIRAIVGRIIQDAVSGDVKAARFIFEYTIGLPVHREMEELAAELEEKLETLQEALNAS